MQHRDTVLNNAGQNIEKQKKGCLMALPKNNPLKEVHFYCNSYRKHYNKEPDRVEEVPEQAYHPYRYFSICPHCNEEHEMYFRERNLLLAHAKATGPKTPEGIEATSKNLIGHPTPEETKITRFNALKHGIYSRTATYYPAKPGKYDSCETCDIDWEYCAEQPACLRKLELFMKHHIAQETKNPELLRALFSDLQANLFGIQNSMILDIIAKGVSIETPIFYIDKEGQQQFVTLNGEPITEIKANPLLKPLIEFTQKNNLSLGDMGMTPKAQDEHELIQGTLSSDQQNQESIIEFQAKQQASLENLQALIKSGDDKLKNDPILIEYQQEEASQE